MEGLRTCYFNLRSWGSNWWCLLSGRNWVLSGNIASRIYVTPKVVYLPISKLHSILAVANLLAHNNISEICYCSQISLQSAAVNCSFSDNLTPLLVTFTLLAVVLAHVIGTNGRKIPFTPKGGRFDEDNFLKLLVGSQPMKEGRSLICGRWG